MFRLLLLACVLASASAASYTLSLKGRQIPLTSSGESPLSLSSIHSALLSSHPSLKLADLTATSAGTPITGDGSLEEQGVPDGATITVRIKSKKAKPKEPAAATPVSAPSPSPPSGGPGAGFGIDQLLQSAGLGDSKDMKELQELMSSMGGMDKPPSDPKEALAMMKTILASPLVSNFINDPAKLEIARQAVLNNPMIKGMLTSSLPGFDAILNDASTWATTLTQAKDM
jgi:hypothetical protein